MIRTPKIIPEENLLYFYSILALVESNYEMEALRFEKGFFERIKDSDNVLKTMEFSVFTSKDTKKMLLACSYGYIQILGYNLVLRGFVFPRECITPLDFIQDCINPAKQYLYLEDFLKRFGFKLEEITKDIQEGKETQELIRFARLWNGSKTYAKRLIELYKQNRRKVEEKIPELKDRIEYYSQAI